MYVIVVRARERERERERERGACLVVYTTCQELLLCTTTAVVPELALATRTAVLTHYDCTDLYRLEQQQRPQAQLEQEE
jgi:hypothetical protein